MDMKHKVPFFNVEDIAILQDVGGTKYDKNNPIHQRKGEMLKNGVWEKTLYWNALVVNKLENTGYVKANSRRLWQNSGNFKHYTWTKIYKKGDEDKGIYFTLGAGQQGLKYKLDYQRVDSKHAQLSSEQKTLSKTLIKTTGTSILIPIDKLKNYTWDNIVDESVSFIIQHSPLYDEAIENVWNINPKRIARITYNTEGWIKPSGEYGKSKSEDSFESENGYGHEEWLFDIAKTYKGYHYAFLEPVRKEHQAYEGNIYDVALFAIDGETKQRFYIGEIFNVKVISEREAKEACQFYQEQGWLDEMKEQVKDVSDYKGFNHWKGLEVFNVRFKISDVKQNEASNIPVFTDNPIYKLNRYTFVHYKEEYNLTENIARTDSYNFDTANDSLLNGNNSGEVKKGAYDRPPKTVEIEYLHQAISDKLLRTLKLDGRNVKKEVPAGYGNNRIDMVESQFDGDIFYEIKTYPSLKTSIRMAIGQLLEYSMWTEQNKAKELIIITQPMSDIEEVKAYFAHLRKIYNIPLYYQSFDIDTNELSEKV